MNERPIRVAQVIGRANNGGVEAFVMNYYKHIDHSKVEFDFLVESTSNIINENDVKKYGNGRIIIIPHYTYFYKYIIEMTRIFKEEHYDIVHSNMNALSVFTLKAAKNAGVPIRIAHSHSTSNKKEVLRNIVKNVLRILSKKYATNYFACSEVAGKWLFGNRTFASGKVIVINNGIDLEEFRFNKNFRLEIRKEYKIPNEAFVIGNIGRFVSQKNHEYLIDIFNEYHKAYSNSYLLMLGDGPLMQKTEDKVNRYHLEKNVIFAGIHKHPSRFYSAMDCFVLPSLYEGLPIVGVEAQVNGLPCFFSDKVTTEAKLTEKCFFKAISFSAIKWSLLISSYAKTDEITRTDAYKIFENKEFDIRKSVQVLQFQYSCMIKKLEEVRK